MTKNLDPRWLVTTELESTGGDPSLFFEIIENIVARRDWEHLPAGSGEPVGTFRRMIEAPPPTGCNLPADKLLKMLELEHRYERRDSKWAARMKDLRTNVKLLLDGELPTLSKHGEIGNGRRGSVTTSTSDDRGTEYALKRLKRDNPELAEQVMRGELSPNAAAIQAGFRPERVAIRLDDMCSAARTLAGRLNGNQLDELITQLMDLRGSR